jgi:hypothetical protein
MGCAKLRPHDCQATAQHLALILRERHLWENPAMKKTAPKKPAAKTKPKAGKKK